MLTVLLTQRAHDLPSHPGQIAFPGGRCDPGETPWATALREAHTEDFRRYAHAIVRNAQALAAALLARGYDLVSGGTDNHLILIDLTNKGISGKRAAQALDRAGLETNYNSVPFDPRKPFDPSGLRIGLAAITSRGLKVEHMPAVGGLIADAIELGARGDDSGSAAIRERVRELVTPFHAPGL